VGRRIEARLGETRSMAMRAVPPLVRARQAVDALLVEAQRLADVAQRARAVGDDGRGERGAVAAVLRVEILDDLLAALVLEVDVDVGRLVALLEMKRSNSIDSCARVDLGDAEAVAHRRVGRRAAALAQDAARAREATMSCTVRK
jgi:hypothetical protein